jgi:hypothetical protein
MKGVGHAAAFILRTFLFSNLKSSEDKSQVHILSRFTRQFDFQDRNQRSLDVSNEEEWSQDSDIRESDGCIDDVTHPIIDDATQRSIIINVMIHCDYFGLQ